MSLGKILGFHCCFIYDFLNLKDVAYICTLILTAEDGGAQWPDKVWLCLRRSVTISRHSVTPEITVVFNNKFCSCSLTVVYR